MYMLKTIKLFPEIFKITFHLDVVYKSNFFLSIKTYMLTLFFTENTNFVVSWEGSVVFKQTCESASITLVQTITFSLIDFHSPTTSFNLYALMLQTCSFNYFSSLSQQQSEEPMNSHSSGH